MALTQTGMSRESARFQARSAFTGSGFTTTESERVVNHPVRRRIIMLLMFLGNVGIVSAMSSLIISFVRQNEQSSMILRMSFLAAGLLTLYLVSTSEWVDKHLSKLIAKLLKRYSRIDVRDYASLMHLSGEYRIAEIKIEDNDWLNGISLGKAKLRDEGIVILGIERADGSYTGAPNGDSKVYAEDVLLAYGREKALAKLDERDKDAGQKEHRKAVKEQRNVEKKEQDRESKMGKTKEKQSAA